MPRMLIGAMLLVLLNLVLGTGAAGAQTADFLVENGSDRPGGDYNSFPTTEEWQSCQTACEEDGRCVAWTWVRPGVQGPEAMCWLKDVMARPTPARCCVSGARVTAVPPPGAYADGVDRPGSDYDSFDLPFGSGSFTCALACMAESRCAAWTFVRSGVQGRYPRCWLKEAVPEPVSSDCCSSGVR